MAKLPETPDLAVAGLVVTLALVAFIAVLWLNRDAKGSPGKGKAGGSVYTSEGGKQVRRSTRSRKSVADEALLATPKPTPKVRVCQQRGMICAAASPAGRCRGLITVE
jgi:hypothetical protein